MDVLQAAQRVKRDEGLDMYVPFRLCERLAIKQRETSESWPKWMQLIVSSALVIEASFRSNYWRELSSGLWRSLYGGGFDEAELGQ